MSQSRTIVIAVDESDCSRSASHWWCTNWVCAEDVIHLVGVIGPVSAGMAPALPMGTAGAVTAMHASYVQEYEREEKRCKALLVAAKKDLAETECRELHAHVLPAAGGASGVAESIVAWAKKENADVVVVGSRGMGAAKSTLMSVVGLGSVSAYVLHHLTCPVCLVRGKGLEAPRKAVRKVLVAVDDSEAAQRAQRWAEDNALGPQDELHLVCVAYPIPYVIAEDDVAAACVSEAELSAEGFYSTKDSRSYARETLEAAVAGAAKKVDRSCILYKALEPEGGASEVGLSILHYAQANGIDIAVMGSRGVGAVKRALLAIIGLGSVSEWCAHNLECPLVIVK